MYTAWLSLLIPTYEYPTGVLRILDRLHATNVTGIECIINDDSRTDIVQIAVLNHPLYQMGAVKYHRNEPTLGAVLNWNELLKKSSGEFQLLMHHDECPENDSFFSKLKSILDDPDSPDLLILNCLIPTFNRRLRQHTPVRIKRILLSLCPDHLLLHNSLGPPSVVVVRRTKNLLFNPKLRWLVDVDWMVKILRLPNINFQVSNELAVISIANSDVSITKNLKENIDQLRILEAKIIKNNCSSDLKIFRLLLPKNLIECAISFIEKGCWLFLRLVIKTTGWVNGRRLPYWL